MLAIVSKCHNISHGNPFALMEQYNSAFLTGLVVVSCYAGYQMLTCARELLFPKEKVLQASDYMEEAVPIVRGVPSSKVKKVLWEGEGFYRLARLGLFILLGTIALIAANRVCNGNFNPIEMLEKSRVAFLATLIVGCVFASYQLVTLGKELRAYMIVRAKYGADAPYVPNNGTVPHQTDVY